MDYMKLVEKDGIKEKNKVSIGDTVKVYFKIIEGQTERIQVYEGVVMARKNQGIRESITVRKISYGIGVERVFPINSPRIEKIEIIRSAKIRKSKLYFLRDKVGKQAKLKEKIERKKI